MYSEFVQKMFLPPHLLDHRYICCSLKLSTYEPSSKKITLYILFYFFIVL